MKRFLKKIACLLSVVGFSSSIADTGPLFNVIAYREPGLIRFPSSLATLQITTNVPNKMYSSAGIKLITPPFLLSSPGVDCSPVSNGYCLFSVSSSDAASIGISTIPMTTLSIGNTDAETEVDMILCLDATDEPLSCEKHSVFVALIV